MDLLFKDRRNAGDVTPISDNSSISLHILFKTAPYPKLASPPLSRSVIPSLATLATHAVHFYLGTLGRRHPRRTHIQVCNDLRT
jgi:hypothetical protein